MDKFPIEVIRIYMNMILLIGKCLINRQSSCLLIASFIDAVNVSNLIIVVSVIAKLAEPISDFVSRFIMTKIVFMKIV